MLCPIQMASQLSGLSPHVIRIWERRYGALNPSRTDTNRRMYGQEAIARLKLLRELTENGHRIGNIAHLPTEELQKRVEAELKQTAPESGTASFSVDATAQLETPEQYVNLYIEVTKAYDSDRLRRLLLRSRQQFGQRGMLHHVICPLIQSVGEAWQAGNLRPSHEHVATSVIREFLMTPVPGSQTAASAPEIIITTLSGEMHEMGALLAAATARDLGWKITYLGPNLPIEEIAACAKARNACAVALSVDYPEKCPIIRNELIHIRQVLPESVTLIVGGRASRGYQECLTDLPILWVHSLCDLEKVLLKLQRPAQQQLTAPQSSPDPLADVKEVMAATAILHASSGRLSATQTAAVFGLSVEKLGKIIERSRQALTQTPDAESIQEALRPFERIARLRAVLHEEKFLTWLNRANLQLDGHVPIALIKEGRAKIVADLAEDMLLGTPS